MLRFDSLLEQGLRVAAMSGTEDGDCSYHCPDRRRAFLRRAGGEVQRAVGLRQVHGNRVLTVDDSFGGLGCCQAEDAPAADGLVTNTPGLALLIGAADCVPVLLYAPEKGVLAALHAGRAGTYANIAGVGVRAMAQRYGVRPEGVHVLIGPSICVEHYEVSEDLAAEFRARGLPTLGRRLDLWAANRQQVEAAGVPAENIRVARRCTYEDKVFFSFRRDRTDSRNLIAVSL